MCDDEDASSTCCDGEMSSVRGNGEVPSVCGDGDSDCALSLCDGTFESEVLVCTSWTHSEATSPTGCGSWFFPSPSPSSTLWQSSPLSPTSLLTSCSCTTTSALRTSAINGVPSSSTLKGQLDCIPSSSLKP